LGGQRNPQPLASAIPSLVFKAGHEDHEDACRVQRKTFMSSSCPFMSRCEIAPRLRHIPQNQNPKTPHNAIIAVVLLKYFASTA